MLFPATNRGLQSYIEIGAALGTSKETRRRRNKINDANLMKVQKQLMLALAATQIVVQYQYNVDVALAALWTDPVSATQRHRRPA